jgi:RecB family exonuclease
MIKDGVAIVVDYKTGKAEPKYARQLELYGLLLEEMGYTEVEKYILYIDEPYILEKI